VIVDSTVATAVNYDGRRFRGVETDAHGGHSVAAYHQDGDLFWGEAAGGTLRRGSVTGVCGPDGVLDFAYSFVLTDGRIISGRCHSTPETLPDGRLRLREDWQRFGLDAAVGVSYLEELPDHPTS
jgi:hypothetical protein